jgi:putative addiction module component (TIGR02574 family)
MVKDLRSALRPPSHVEIDSVAPRRCGLSGHRWRNSISRFFIKEVSALIAPSVPFPLAHLISHNNFFLDHPFFVPYTFSLKGNFLSNQREVNLMSREDLLKKALKLKPAEKFILVEGILRSLDEPDSAIDQIWTEEAVKRLKAYRKGNLEGIPMEEIFNEKQ